MKVAFIANNSPHTVKWIDCACSYGLQVVWIIPAGNQCEGRIVHNPQLRIYNLAKTTRILGYLQAHLLSSEILREEEPDVVHGHYLVHNGLIAAEACNGIPLVLSAWGTDVMTFMRYPLFNQLIERAVRRADLVTTCGSHIRAYLISRGIVTAERCINLPFGVDTNRFQCAQSSTREKEYDLISTRNHERVYDLPTLLHAIAILRIEFNVHPRCLIAGIGSRTPDLVRLSRTLGIEDEVSFVGAVDQSMIQDVLCKARFYVSCSLSDGASVSLLEAMSCGLVPVVSDIPANRPWIDSTMGRFFEVGNPESLAASIAELMRKDERELGQMGNRSRSIAEKKGSLEKTIGNLTKYYSKAIEYNRFQSSR